MSERPKTKSIEKLLADWYGGTLSPHNYEELVRRLRDDESALETAAKQLVVERFLQAESLNKGDLSGEVMERLRISEPDLRLTEKVMEKITEKTAQPTAKLTLRRSAGMASNRSKAVRSGSARPIIRAQSGPSFGSVLLKIAAVLVLGFGTWWMVNRRETDAAPVLGRVGVGDDHSETRELSTVLGRVWSVDDSSGSWQPGMELSGGEYDLAEGSVEIRLFPRIERLAGSKSETGSTEDLSAGVRLIIEGPARFSLDSSDRVQLFSGKLSAEVFPVAKGFTVAANGVDVVDWGTRFAVSVNLSGETAIHVYDGIVKAALEASDAAAHTLVSGNTVRLNPAAGGIDPIEFESQLFAPRPVWNGSLEEASPTIRVMAHALRNPKRGIRQSKKMSFIYKECDGLTLNRDITVNLAEPRRVTPVEGRRGEFVSQIPAGTTVTSYLANFTLEDGKTDGEVTFKFDSPILGVIYNHDLIIDTDSMLGASRTDYSIWRSSSTMAETAALTGLESCAWVWIHEDRRTVTFGFGRPVGNQVRILVAKDSN
jgi:hypothetical protein